MAKRRIASLLVTATMAFSVMAPAFAATPTDVVGTTYEDSVGRLSALGIIAGYEDGTFKPDQNITRAEFAKIAVYELGLQNAADLAKGTTKFADVASDHWAAGYINIATEKGIIKGYPDKTFKPSENVSYAEAITILVRALGLGQVVEGKGTWPSNYLSKASEAGITDGLTSVDGSAKAIRGNIAKLAWNTITAEKWGEKEYGVNGVVYGPLGKSILKEKFADFVDANGEAKVVENATVIANQLVGGLEANKISYKKEDNTVVANVEVLDTKIDLTTLVGKKVDIFLGKDNKIAAIKVVSSEIKGLVDSINTDTNKIKVGTTEYTMATSNTVLVNKQAKTLAQAKAILATSTATATVVLDTDNKVSILDMFVADTNAGLNTTQAIVKEIKTNKDVMPVVGSTKIFNLDEITGVTGSSSNVAFVVKNGKTATINDIKAGDVVTYINLNGDKSVNIVVVTDNKVTGSLTSAGYISANSYKLTVAGTSYNMSDDVKMTKTGNAADYVTVDNTIADLLNKDVTLSLSANGEIVMVNGTVVASSAAAAQYGITTKAAWQSSTPDADGKLPMYVELRTTAGEKKVFKVKGEKMKTAGATIPATAATTITFTGNTVDQLNAAGVFVQFKVEADGTINAANLVKINTAVDSEDTTNTYYADAVTPALADVNADAKSIKDGSTNYYINSNTIILNKNADKLEVVDGGFDKLVTGDTLETDLIATNAIYFVYDNSTKMIKFMVVDAASYLGTTTKFGVITSTAYIGVDEDNNPVNKLKINTDGVESTYTVTTNVYDTTVEGAVYTAAVGDVVAYTLDNDGNFVGGTTDAERLANFLVDASRVATNDNNAFDDYVVTTVNAADRLIYFKGNDDNARSIKVTSDVKVYDVTGTTPAMKTLADIQAGNMVVEINHADAKDGVMYKILVIVKK